MEGCWIAGGAPVLHHVSQEIPGKGAGFRAPARRCAGLPGRATARGEVRRRCADAPGPTSCARAPCPALHHVSQEIPGKGAGFRAPARRGAGLPGRATARGEVRRRRANAPVPTTRASVPCPLSVMLRRRFLGKMVGRGPEAGWQVAALGGVGGRVGVPKRANIRVLGMGTCVWQEAGARPRNPRPILPAGLRMTPARLRCRPGLAGFRGSP